MITRKAFKRWARHYLDTVDFSSSGWVFHPGITSKPGYRAHKEKYDSALFIRRFHYAKQHLSRHRYLVEEDLNSRTLDQIHDRYKRLQKACHIGLEGERALARSILGIPSEVKISRGYVENPALYRDPNFVALFGTLSLFINAKEHHRRIIRSCEKMAEANDTYNKPPTFKAEFEQIRKLGERERAHPPSRPIIPDFD